MQGGAGIFKLQSEEGEVVGASQSRSSCGEWLEPFR